MDFSALIGKRFLKLNSQPREFLHFVSATEAWHNYEGEKAKKCLYATDREYFSVSWGVGAVYDCYPSPEMTRFTEHAKSDEHEWSQWDDEKFSDESHDPTSC